MRLFLWGLMLQAALRVCGEEEGGCYVTIACLLYDVDCGRWLSIASGSPVVASANFGYNPLSGH
jgi:hypothetical protein